MRLFSSWLRRSWTTLLLGVLVVAVGIAAFINPGVEATELKLNEGAVYVQSQDRAKIGALNYQIDEISDATGVGDTRSTLLQEGRTVVINNAGSSTLQTYDPASNSLSSPVSPPVNSQISMNAGVLSVTNPENGKVWFGPVEQMTRSDFRGKANLDLLDWGKAIVTTSGQVIGINVQDSTIVRPDGSVVPIPFQVDNSAPTVELSAIGEKAVVLDRVSQQIWVEGDRQATTISSGSSASLAPPVPDDRAAGRGGSAIYATQAGLNTIVGGAPQSLSGLMNANPTPPVVVGECAYGAFGDRFVKVCGGEDPQISDIPQMPIGAQLAFQVNRGNVVLQDVASGQIWLVDKEMKIVNDWDRFDRRDQQRTDDPNPPDERTTLPDRTLPNRPPIAVDDPDLGARAGRSTTLPILDNDSDDDGDIITVVETTRINGASLEFTGNGAGLQITLPADATGSQQFTYTISDGRGGTATAVATVKALPADQAGGNQKPVNIRPGETMIMSSNSTASKRVLVTWRDPDGDDLVLVNAMPEDPDSEDEVTFTPDGFVTFRDVGKSTGAKRVRVWVSDGVTTVEGFLNIDVRTRDAAPPIANGDFVSTMVAREVVVHPLANDEGNNLILTEIEGSTNDYTVTPNYPEGTFRFRATTPGTYYLLYKVSNGPVSSGLVRIDVLPITNSNNAPVAVRDTALVPFGGSVVIDPLLNDTDADNDVLVVQSVSQDPAIQVIMQERHLLTISMVRHTDAPVPLTYWVSDGRNSTRGTIMVFPAPESGDSRPRAVNDHVKVRAGAIASVSVLANDVSPRGLPLKVSGLPGNPFGDGAWIDGEKVRIAIPEETAATTMTLTYEISDGSASDSATVIITVISADAQNEAPIPPVVEARVLSNSITRIPIKLAGVDPNGDSVRLLGLGSGPGLGRIVEVGDGWIRYEAYPDSRGTDTFRYQVIDSLGAVGTGEMRVGVAPPSDDNTGPIGVLDEVHVRPGRTVTLPVLQNDYDIDGDQFGFLESNAIEMEFPAQITDGQFISATAPDEPGEYQGKYYLIDKRGEPGDGTILLIVDPEAPLLPPVALDDQLAVNDIIDQEWVEVDVMANDYDIDGPREQLTLSLPQGGPEVPTEEVAVVDGKLSIQVSDVMQQVRYVITDADGLSSQALVIVPGRGDSVPVLADPLAVNTVEAGKVFSINFDTVVLGTQGRHVVLTSPETVRATKGTVNIRPDGIDFHADVSYAGPASVVFEVIDQADPTDRSAKRAFITVSITVTPAATNTGREQGGVETSNRAPDGPANISIEVGAGEPDQQFPLRPRFSDPEGDNFSFQSWSEVSGNPGVTWSASVGGDVIIARGGLTNKGAQATLAGRVVDSFGASREITVTITVVGSTRPLPVAQTDAVADANAGQPVSVPVLANDRSYLLDDPGLTLLSASVVSGSGTASVNGDNVVVTPERDFVGPTTVRYTIVDATNDSARQVDGAIQLVVRARPSTPGTPTIEAEGDKQVTIKWTSNSDNGMPVIQRQVIATGANGTSVTFLGCATNTCTVTGLTNNVGYTFSVSEGNVLGMSDPSNSSAVGTPDVKPPPLNPATLIFPGPNMSGRLDLRWDAPIFDGSPITSYTVSSVDGSVPDVTVDGLTTNYEFAGLTNYKAYQFIVTATNNAGTSDPSPASNAEHPSAPPPAASNVVAVDIGVEKPQLNVTWALPAQEGDPFEVSVVATSAAGDVVVAVDPAATAVNLDNLVRRQTYTTVVKIKTRGGESISPPSPPIEATDPPQAKAPGDFAVAGPDLLTFYLPPAGTEWDSAIVQLLANGQPLGAGVTVLPGGRTNFTVTDYSVDYTVRTTPVYKGKPGTAQYQWTSPEPLRAFGLPEPYDYGIDRTADGQVVVFYTGEVYKNGTSNLTYTYLLNGVEQGEYPLRDMLYIETAGVQMNIQLKACDSFRGVCGTSAVVQLPPPLTASVSGQVVSITLPYAGDWSCRISGGVLSTQTVAGGGTSSFTVGTAETPVTPGTYTVTCSQGNADHQTEITFA